MGWGGTVPAYRVEAFNPLQCLPASLIWALTVLLQVSQGLPLPGNYRAISASPLRLDPFEEFASYPLRRGSAEDSPLCICWIPKDIPLAFDIPGLWTNRRENNCMFNIHLCFRNRKSEPSQSEPSNLYFFLSLLDGLMQKNRQSKTTVRESLIPVSVRLYCTIILL